MFVVNTDKSIFVTRGDVGTIVFRARMADQEDYTFQVGDVVRLKVFKKKQHDAVVLQKDVVASEIVSEINIELTGSDTKLGEIINKPVDYWYEIELNPDTTPQTIIGYDEDGPKIFRLFPEGGTQDE